MSLLWHPSLGPLLALGALLFVIIIIILISINSPALLEK
jgi:hypothetical protein